MRWGTRPLGATAGGLVAQMLGLRAVFVAAAMLTLALLAGMVRVRYETIDAAQQAAT